MPDSEAKIRARLEGGAETTTGLKDLAAAQDGVTKEGVKATEQAGKYGFAGNLPDLGPEL